jgi:tetratricopeptide (TPR) repeat protein
MDSSKITGVQKLFGSLQHQQSGLDTLSQKALSKGIELYMQKDYEGAIREFRRSIGLSPRSKNSANAADYMAKAFLQSDDTESALKTYRMAIQLNPLQEDIRVKLGNLLFAEERYQEAEKEYRQAVRLNPTLKNCFSLGQACLHTGRYKEAEIQFNQVRRMEPKKPNGNYGLGLLYSKQGRYEDAVGQFQRAIELKKDFYDAYAEMGYAYASMGQSDKAQEIEEFLETRDSSLAETLGSHRYEVSAPRMLFAYSYGSTFNFRFSTKTPLSSLDAYLSTAGASKTFTMKFQFDKEMDRASVENRFNWNIARAEGRGPGQSYNFGLPVPESEIVIAPVPQQVICDSKALTATVYFTVSQNASADGTIDPSHIKFTFHGKDRFGLAMDSTSDQFSGFSGIA